MGEERLKVEFHGTSLSRSLLQLRARAVLQEAEAGRLPPHVDLDITSLRDARLLDMLCVPILADVIERAGPQVTTLFARPGSGAASSPLPEWNCETGPLWNLYGDLGLRRETLAGTGIAQTASAPVAPPPVWSLHPVRTQDEHWSALDTVSSRLRQAIARVSSLMPPAVDDFCHSVLEQLSDNVHRHSGVGSSDGSPRVGALAFRIGRVQPGRPSDGPLEMWETQFAAAFAGREYLELAVIDSGAGMVSSLLLDYPDLRRRTPADALSYPFMNRLWRPGDTKHQREGCYQARVAVEEWHGVLHASSGGAQYVRWSVPGGCGGASDANGGGSWLPGTQIHVLFPLDTGLWRRAWSTGLQPRLRFDDLPAAVDERDLRLRRFGVRDMVDGSVVHLMDDSHYELVRRSVREQLRARPLEPREVPVVDFTGAEAWRADKVGRLVLDLLAENPCLRGRMVLGHLLPGTVRRLQETVLEARLRERGLFCAVRDAFGEISALCASDVREPLTGLLRCRSAVRHSTIEREFPDAVSFQRTMAQYLRAPHGLVRAWEETGDTLYAAPNLRELFAADLDRRIRSQLGEAGVAVRGHFVLPDGEHVDSYVNGAMLLADRGLRRLVALRFIEAFLRGSGERIRVCSVGEPGVALCEELVAAGLCTTCTVWAGPGYPPFHVGGEPERGETVVVFTPVLRTGEHVPSLIPADCRCAGVVVLLGPGRDVCRPLEARLGCEVEVICEQSVPAPEGPAPGEEAGRPGSCVECSKGTPADIVDPFYRAYAKADYLHTGGDQQLGSPAGRLGSIVDGPPVAKELLHHLTKPRGGAPATPMLERKHWLRDGRHYTWYAHTPLMLGDALVREACVSAFARLVAAVREGKARRAFVLAYPDHLSAIVLAYMLSGIIPEHTYLLPHKLLAPGQLRVERSRVRTIKQDELPAEDLATILLDDSANTGGTMLAIAESMSALGWPPTAGFVLVDRLVAERRHALLARVGYWHAAVRLPIPVYGPHNCPECARQRHGNELSHLAVSEETRAYLASLAGTSEPVHYELPF